MPDQPIKVVILGGGFAGVYTGMYLERLLRRWRGRPVQITIVSRENYIVFQPLLPDVISGAIEILHVVSPIRKLVRKASLYSREIEHVDLERRIVRLAPDFIPQPLELPFDQLVLAMGTTLDTTKVPGMHEHALSFKYLGDALRLRHHIVHVLEAADIEPDPRERAKLLTFVVAGGGFSGVECIAEMHDFVRRACRAYQNIRPQDCRFLLLQSAERILPEMAERLALFAQEKLRKRGIEILLNTRLSGVTADQARYVEKAEKGQPGPAVQTVAARTVVATVPAGPHPMLSSLPCPIDRGRVKVGAQLGVEGWPGVWALGDCAIITQADGTVAPPTAQHAVRQAKICAQNILASIDSRPLASFFFPGLGKLGSLGRGSAVAEVLGLKFSGILAWLMWRGVYLSKLPGWDRKVRVLSDWLLDLFLPRDITQVRIFQPDDVRRAHFEPGEVVFHEGDFGDKLYFIAKGSVEVVKNGQVLATLAAGSQFGELALVSDQPRSATIRAATSLDVVTVSRGAFHSLLTHLPGMRETMDRIIGAYLPASSTSASNDGGQPVPAQEPVPARTDG